MLGITSSRADPCTAEALTEAQQFQRVLPENANEEPSRELLRVLRGEMTEQEYLVGCVEKALSHVKGRISAHRLEVIRQTLLMKLETDPLLHTIARVFRRTGAESD